QSRLFTLLDEEVRESDLIRKAITHRSASKKNNERLEFLGDSVLSLVITEHLYQRMPDASEGDLSRMRAHLVKGTTLAAMAQELGLGEYLRLGPGELKSGGFRRHSIMEDAIEAIIGAVFLMRGFPTAREYILELFKERLDNLPARDSLKDPKSRLQEWLQSRGKALPLYEVVDVQGEAHKQTFTCECRVESEGIVTTASGSSRRKAEQKTAADAFEIIQQT
ncbi:unnamed protein product, partial [Cyprideis torosa]